MNKTPPLAEQIYTSNAYVHPSRNLWGDICSKAFNCKRHASLRRALLSKLPFLKLTSDIEDVVYINWLVDLKAFEPFIPKGVGIKSINGRTIFTALTFKHNHYGPTMLGPLRQFFPSPLQSNWRLYVDELQDELKVAEKSQNAANAYYGVDDGMVLFLKNTLDSLTYTAGSRLASDALPSHLAQTMQHSMYNDLYTTHITSGRGSAPELWSQAALTHEKTLPTEWQEWFGGWDDALNALCMQKSAIARIETLSQAAEQRGAASIAHAGIELPVNIGQVLPLEVKELNIPFLEALNANPSKPWAFLVPQIKFKALWERTI